MQNAEEQLLKQLLASKVQDSSEIEHHLFELCNLNCSFCGQDHDSKEGIDTILEKAHQTVEFMRNSPLKSHTVNVMGGEIFNDLVPDTVFSDYYEFYSIINNYAKGNNLTVRVNFVTNLIFSKNTSNVQKLLEQCGDNVWISTSYDFAGRGLDLNRMMMFKRNLEIFKPRIGVVGFVLAKPSIRKLIADKDKFFKEVLYMNFPLYFDYYVPEASSDKMMPSDQEMLDAFSFIAENYPEVEPVKSMLKNKENKMTCFSLNKTTITPDGKEVKCRYLKYDAEQFETPIDYSTNAGIINTHLERNECFSCEWYMRCTLGCFVSSDWAARERLPICFMKTFFNTAKDKGFLHQV
jgi:radical SAM protein with 4Fe4S-binding SPASM domain